jgi:hypothetical protein
MITILGSVLDIIRGGEVDLYDHLMSTKNLHFDNEQNIHKHSKSLQQSGYNLANHLVPIVCSHTLQEVD